MPHETDRILIAEDHQVSRQLLEIKLGNWGYRTITASDGEEAFGILEGDDAPSIAILDWMMPKLEGPEVCRRLRACTERPYIYLILLTARSGKDEIAAGLDAGADDYVVKPFDGDELRARIKVGQRVVSLERRLARKVVDLEEALEDVQRVKRLLPICMYCKSIRDDKAYWRQLEEYMHTETGTDFSHGICPACMAKIEAGDMPPG